MSKSKKDKLAKIEVDEAVQQVNKVCTSVKAIFEMYACILVCVSAGSSINEINTRPEILKTATNTSHHKAIE